MANFMNEFYLLKKKRKRVLTTPHHTHIQTLQRERHKYSNYIQYTWKKNLSIETYTENKRDTQSQTDAQRDGKKKTGIRVEVGVQKDYMEK